MELPKASCLAHAHMGEWFAKVWKGQPSDGGVLSYKVQHEDDRQA